MTFRRSAKAAMVVAILSMRMVDLRLSRLAQLVHAQVSKVFPNSDARERQHRVESRP